MTTQKRLSPVTLVTYILLIGITTAASAGDVPAWVQEQLLTPYYAAFNAEDANGLADFYTSDARTDTASGRSEIIANFESDWAEIDISCSNALDGFQIVGDLATGWGHDTCIVTPKSGGESKTERIRWLAVYERQANGTWLCSREWTEPADG